MKKLVFVAIIAALAVPVLANPTIVIDSYPGGDMYFSADSGLTFLNGTQTFCIEGGPLETREFTPGTAYEYTIDDTVKHGGYTSTNPWEATVFDNTKKIYSAILNGDATLAGKTNQQLQDMIWNSQISITSGDADAATLTKIGGWQNVKALNLWLPNAENPDKPFDKQSHLIRVPAPGAFLLGGLGVACVGWIKRRRML